MANERQVGPPIQKGPYLIRVIDDPSSDVLVKASLIAGVDYIIEPGRHLPQEIRLTNYGIEYIIGGYAPHDVLIDMMRIAGLR